MTPIELQARNSKVVPENTYSDGVSDRVCTEYREAYLPLLEIAFPAQARIII
jgi:hypothetical protein